MSKKIICCKTLFIFLIFSLNLLASCVHNPENPEPKPEDKRIAQLPVISTQPQSQNVFPAQEVTLSVQAKTVEEDATLSYAWYKLEEQVEFELEGQTDSTYTFVCPQVADTDQLIQTYFAIVKSTLPNQSTAQIKTQIATITVSRKNAVTPTITKQPSKLKMDVNQTGTISVQVEQPVDGGTLSYKWYKIITTQSVQQVPDINSENPEDTIEQTVVEQVQEEILDQTDSTLNIPAEDHFVEYKVCAVVTNTNPSATENQTASITTNQVTVKIGDKDVVYPKPFTTRTENLNFIFSNQSVAEVQLTVSRNNWNSICSDSVLNGPKVYYNADFKISRKDVQTQKEYSWQINNVGLRTKGATSRKVKPQSGSTYQQASFKIDFEEFISDTDPERRLADCIKGLNLKRFKDDSTFVREIYSFDFFRKNGVWTSPRAGYAHVTINIVESVDQDNQPVEVTTKDFGLYEINEETNKQYLKERTVAIGGGDFSDNAGTLWKCWNTNPSYDTDNSRLTLAASDATADKYSIENKQNPSLNIRPAYLKTYDKSNPTSSLNSAKNQIANFIKQLNSFDFTTPESINDACQWFKNRTDVDLLARTFACSVLLGGWDEYWLNGNNFYLYFDQQTSKVYLLPYDYDNVLGIGKSEFNDPAKENPFVWGKNRVRPFIDNFLSVPEFYNLYAKYLKEFSSSEYYSLENSSQRITNWQQLISEKIASLDLIFGDTASSISDGTAITNWDSYKSYKLLDSDADKNFFLVKQSSLEKYLNSTVSVTFNANGSDVQLKKYDDQLQVLDVEGTSFTISDVQCNLEISKLIPAPVRSGYIFLGWKLESSSQKLISNLPYKDSTLNLYASWEENINYQITFDANGGTFENDSTKTQFAVELKKGVSLENNSLVKIPTCDGKIFIGWYTLEVDGELIQTVQEEGTYFAHWVDLQIVPAVFSEQTIQKDGKTQIVQTIKFSFCPEKFGFYNPSEIEQVKICGFFNNFSETENVLVLEEDTENPGYYQGQLQQTILPDSENNWTLQEGKFKFCIQTNFSTNWLGWNSYQLIDSLSDYFKGKTENKNFLIPWWIF